jgi:hypothetical protein
MDTIEPTLFCRFPELVFVSILEKKDLRKIFQEKKPNILSEWSKRKLIDYKKLHGSLLQIQYEEFQIQYEE